MALKNESFLNSYLKDVSKLVQNNLELTKTQLETLNEMNGITLVHYQKNLDKVQKIHEEVQSNNQLYDKIKVYFKRIDQIGEKIEGMESSVEYLSVILDRIDNKLQDLEKK